MKKGKKDSTYQSSNHIRGTRTSAHRINNTGRKNPGKKIYQKTTNTVYEISGELKDMKYLILISFAVILLASIAAYFWNPKIDMIDEAIRTISEYAKNLEHQNFFEIASFIFLNNIRTALIITVIGLIPFFPLLTNISNGLIIGIVMRAKIEATKNFWTIFLVLPHGIFEIPALCIATALGLRVGLKLIGMKMNATKKDFKGILISNAVIFATVVLPLLVIAAAIEAVVFLAKTH